MSAMLSVRREVGFGFELRRGQFDVSVDGNSVGSLANHGTVDTPIEPGRHTVRITEGRYSSRDHSFELADGEVGKFRCHGANLWPLYVASVVAPNLAISLKRE